MIECTTFFGETKHVPKEKLSFRPAAYGVIVDRGQLLLVTNRNNGKFSLPGGGVEIGERLTDAVMREVREETGIEVDVGQLLHFSERFFYYDPEDLAFHGLCFFYACKPLSFDLLDEEDIEDDEASAPRWVAIEALTPEAFQFCGDEIIHFAKKQAVL